MSKQLAQIGLPGQRLDILAGGDVDGVTGRLLSVAELQRALRTALAGARASGGEHPSRPADPAPVVAAEEPVKARQDRPAGTSGTSGTAFRGAPAGAVGGPAEWGANPVPVGSGVSGRPVAVTRRVAGPPSAAPAGPGALRYPVADLLRCRPRDRDRAVTRVLADRWPGPRRVVFASLTAGAGRSTAAALVCAAAADAGVPALLLDATGGAGPELTARVGGAGTRRDWTRMTGAEAEVDFAALRRRGGADTGVPVCVVAISGDAGKPPPAEVVAAGAAAAARSWPLVLLDIPHGGPSVRAAVRAGGVDLLVLVCRPDPAQITDCAGFLRDLAGGGELDCAQRAVVAVGADRRGLPAAARRALAGVCDTAAGPVTLTHVARLTGRRTAARGPAAVAAGRLLAAAAAAAPPTGPSPNLPEEH